MFKNMQSITNIASKTAQLWSSNIPAQSLTRKEVRLLGITQYYMHLFFGIYGRPDYRYVFGGQDSAVKLQEVKVYLEAVKNVLRKPNPVPHSKPVIWCNSDPLRWMRPDERVPPEMTPEEVPYQLIEDRFPERVEDEWVFYIPGEALNHAVKGAFYFVDKYQTQDDYGEIPDQPFPNSETTSRPDACSDATTRNIHPDEGAGLYERIIILCEDTAEYLPLVVPEYPPGDLTRLGELRPAWSPIYLAMMEIAARHEPEAVVPPTISYAPYPNRPDITQSLSFKANWLIVPGIWAKEPGQCIMLRLYDQARPTATDLEDYAAIYSIPNLLWYSIAVYIQNRNLTREWDFRVPRTESGRRWWHDLLPYHYCPVPYQEPIARPRPDPTEESELNAIVARSNSPPANLWDDGTQESDECSLMNENAFDLPRLAPGSLGLTYLDWDEMRLDDLAWDDLQMDDLDLNASGRDDFDLGSLGPGWLDLDDES